MFRTAISQGSVISPGGDPAVARRRDDKDWAHEVGSPFTARTRRGWIPVTGTGMTEEEGLTAIEEGPAAIEEGPGGMEERPPRWMGAGRDGERAPTR